MLEPQKQNILHFLVLCCLHPQSDLSKSSELDTIWYLRLVLPYSREHELWCDDADRFAQKCKRLNNEQCS